MNVFGIRNSNGLMKTLEYNVAGSQVLVINSAISSRNYIHRIVGLLCLDKYDLVHGINLKTICL